MIIDTGGRVSDKGFSNILALRMETPAGALFFWKGFEERF
jgi:hypothetical protein